MPSTRGLRAPLVCVATMSMLAGLVLIAPPSQAIGSPPTPADDAYTIVDKDTFYVLANDSDPNVQLLTVSDNTQPAHGAVTCQPTGACTYTVTGDYVGEDSFTYTARDPDLNTATATVTITVTGAAPSTNPPTPVPDEIATKADTPVTADVLSNDQAGAGATMTVTTGPSHGFVDCTSAGSCTYTPSAGFVGYDGFGYDVTDAFGTSHGTALLTVVAANAGFQQTAKGRPAAAPSGTSIVQGENAAWSVGAQAQPVGLAQRWAAANPPATTVTLTGPHAFSAGEPTTAPGWNTSSTATTRTFTATSSALLGESTANPLPPPLPPTSQGTGGDGHVPILVGTKVFAFFHHSMPTSVTCLDRATGGLCPGYPHPLNVGTSDTVGPGAVVGTKIYVHALPAASYAQNAPIALYCWDTATDSTCGMIIIKTLLDVQTNPAGSAPRLINGKLYLAADGGLVYCADPATGAACASAPIADGLPPNAAADPSYDAVAHGTRLYVSNSSSESLPSYAVACVNVATNAKCTGWTTAKNLHSPDLVNHHSTSGVADGVCSVDSSSGQCILDATPALISTTGGWPVNELYYSISEEAEAGNRTLFALGNNGGGMGCWNWVTNSVCTGGHWVAGRVQIDSSGADIPKGYGAAFDGTCAVGLGDPGQVFTTDILGTSPCTSLSAGSVRRIVDLRDQRCDGTVGAATWIDLRLVEGSLVAGADFDSLIVAVSDPVTNQILLSSNVVGTSGIINLSGISPVLHPALAIDAIADSPPGNPAWADGNPPRLILTWHSDPAQGCFQTSTVPDCSVSTAQQIGITSTPTSGTPAIASLTLNPRADCKTLTVSTAGAGSGTVTSNPPGIDCGATCTSAWVGGTNVVLTATPAAGSVFTGWSGGGCSGTGTCSVTLNANTTVTATFVVPPPPTLIVSKAGNGSGTVTSDPAGIDCGTTCSAPYPAGTPVTLTAVAADGSTFTGWSGGGCSGTGTCVVTLTANTTVTATFVLPPPPPTLTVSKAGTGTGTVASDPAGIDCGATCSAQYVNGTPVTLTAVAADGSTFTGWSGSGCSGTGTCTVTMTASRAVTATFALPVQRTLTVSKAGTGSGTVASDPAGIDCGATCSAQYASGTPVTLVAAPAGSSTFTGWSGGGCSGSGTCMVTLSANTTVTATFKATSGDFVAPKVKLTSPSSFFSRSRTIHVEWSTTDTGGSGVDYAQVQWRRRPAGGTTFTSWRSEPGWTVVRGVFKSFPDAVSGYMYCFRVRAVDKAGNTGAYSPIRCTVIPLDEARLLASGTWALSTGKPAFFDGTYHETTMRTASLRTRTSVRFTRVSLLVTTCPACGRVAIFVGTTRIATLSLVSDTLQSHVWKSMPVLATARSGVLKISVTSSGAPVRIDALGYAAT